MGMQVAPELRQKMAERLAEHREKVESVAQSSIDPLPGPLAGAFSSEAIQVAPGISVRKVCARDWVILRALNSPLIKLIEAWQKGGGTESAVDASDEDQWAICWQFTRPLAEVKQAFAKGPEELRRLAGEQVGDSEQLNPSMVNLIVMAVLEQIRRGWLTTLKYSQELDEKGEVTFFRDAGESPKMDSAGGSTT